MAMSATITWEFNSGATANMVNGGGFKTGATGVDYSTATAAHLTIADLQSDGADNTKVHSDLTPFDTNDIGNVLHITATGTGFTVGWYEVTAVDASTPPVATLDRTCGGTSLTGGTAYLGGALSLNSTLDSDFFQQLVAGQKVYFKKGNYVLGEATSGVTTAGTTQLPISVIGYTSTRDDTCNDLNRPYISTGAYGLLFYRRWQIKNLIVTSTGTYGVGADIASTLINIKAVNSAVLANYSAIEVFGTNGNIINCEGIAFNGRGIRSGGITGVVVCSYAHHSDTGCSMGNPGSILNSVFANNKTNGITTAGEKNCILNNTIYGSEGKIQTYGINIAANYHHSIQNNIIYGCITGINATATDSQTYINYNDLYNNTTPVTNVTELSNDIAADPLFTNAAGTLIEDCEDAWNEQVIANVTASLETTIKKVGSGSAKFAITATFTTGVIGSEVIASTNMSTYNGISCWIYSDHDLAAGDLQLLLDDHANCVSPVLTYNFPGMSATIWYWVYLCNLDMTSATAIISIGLKQNTDHDAAYNIYIDDVRGCNNDFSLGGASTCINTGLSYCKPAGTG